MPMLLGALFAPIACPAGLRMEVQGNHVVDTGEIRRILGRSGEVPVSIARIQGIYYSRGYLSARFFVEYDRDSTSVKIRIEEGEQARYGNVNFKATIPVDEKELGRKLGAAAGMPFRPLDLDRRIKALLDEFDREGYPFVQIWIDGLEFHPGTGTVDLSLFLMDGGKKKLSKIVFEGLRRTRPEVASRISGLKEGETYSGDKVSQAVERLEAMQYFTSVRPARIVLSPDGGSVEAHIEVEEPRRRHSMAGAMGYAQGENGGSGVLSGFARMNLVNIGGRLKDLGVDWSNDGAGRSETRIRFLNRMFLGRRMDVGAEIEQTGLDTVYTWQSLGVRVGVPLHTGGGSYVKGGLSLHADRNIFSVGELLRSWRGRLTVGVSWFRRFAGRKGYIKSSVDVSIARKKSYNRSVPAASRHSQFIVGFKNALEVPMGRFRLHDSIVYNGIESNEESIPLSEQFYLGGAATLRGYRENQFHGTRTALNRLELRLGDQGEHVYLFADVGYVSSLKESPGGGTERDDFTRSGYGFGVRTPTSLGSVDLSFGVGERLSLEQTKVHVILGYDF
jgi:outer membrane protein insertion porin family